MKEIQASEFKAKCLAILDEIAEQGEPITITKRGRPVAQLIPTIARVGRFPQDELKGTVSFQGDVIGPVLPVDSWEAEGASS